MHDLYTVDIARGNPIKHYYMIRVVIFDFNPLQVYEPR